MKRLILRCFKKFSIWWSRKSEYEGIQIGVDRTYNRQTEVKLHQALALIRDVSPSRFMRIRREVSLMRVSPLMSNLAEWRVTEKECVVDGNYLRSSETTLTKLAATLIHEATHARIDRLGIDYTEDRRSRIERICFMEGIRFAKKRPDGEAVIRDAEVYLAQPDSYWSDSVQDDALLESFRKDCPKWLYRWVERRIRGKPESEGKK